MTAINFPLPDGAKPRKVKARTAAPAAAPVPTPAPRAFEPLEGLPATLTMPMVSGLGKYATDKDGTTPEQLTSITFYQVRRLVDNPAQGVEKSTAQWLIPSTLMARKKERQEAEGQYVALWGDLDEPTTTIIQTADVIRRIVGGCDFEVYASKSATKERQKCRILIPLHEPLTPAQWVVCAEVFNRKMEAAGLVPDKASETLSQVLYLPNEGAFYDCRVARGGELFKPLVGWSGDIAAREAELAKEREAEQAKREAAKRCREDAARQRVGQTHQDPIDAFNDNYDPSEFMLNRGYEQRGDKYRHPASQTGNFSASIVVGRDGKRRVHSLSSSDPLYTGGGGVGAHDAFSTFATLVHGGDRDKALKDACDRLLFIDGEFWNVVKKREWAERQRQERQRQQIGSAGFDIPLPDVADTHTNGLQGQQGAAPLTGLALLKSFALNGQSQAMRAKMVDDVHILGKLALMGQITAFYTERNGGKTLLTLWLLIDSIKRGVIDAADVFYINSDDTHKGLVEKIEFAETWGFQMLADGYKGPDGNVTFKNEMLPDVLRGMCEADEARGKVVILDTLKKFTDVMKIEKGTAFMQQLRAFALKGGSVILLGHVNKHRGDDGKLIYKGTTDVVDDADCYYIMDKVQKQDVTIVTFENGKARGDVAMKACYSFHRIPEGGQTYADLLGTVREVGDDDVTAAREEAEKTAFAEKHQGIVDSIIEAIEMGKTKRTELVAAAHDSSGESKKKVSEVLDKFTGNDYWGSGHRWQVTKGQTSGKVYSVLPAILNGMDMNAKHDTE